MRHLLPLLVTLALVAGCGAPEPAGPGPAETAASYARSAPTPDRTVPDDAEAQAFARAFLDSIQAASIADRVEYCGYFKLTEAGEIAATPPRRGTFASCNMPAPRPGEGVFASYHTHGAFGAQYDNEVPSVTDLLSDFAYGIDGYVSTPGGRVWLVDYGTRSTLLVCGPGCVTTDPGFRPVGEAQIRARYDLPALDLRSQGPPGL